MAYAHPDDIRRIWNKALTTELTPEELASFIDQAAAMIDAALGRRYTVPFAAMPNTPPIIRWIAATLALLEVVDRSPATPEWVLRKIQRAEKQLELLASGELTVPGATERTDIGGIQTTTEDYVPVFGAVPSLDERWDPNRARDEAAERGITLLP
jgi:phage gp36-like protein